MAKVEIKQPIVDEIAGYLADAQAMVLVDYRGLTVEEDTQLRKALREAGVDYKVYKNTLIKRAVKGTVFEAVTDLCEGPTAIATSASDATAPARVLYEAAKKMPNLELKGGVVDGTFYDVIPVILLIMAHTISTIFLSHSSLLRIVMNIQDLRTPYKRMTGIAVMGFLHLTIT